MGGRGIGNRIELHIKNGLAKFIFSNPKSKNINVKVIGNNVVFE
jgi:ATP-dependent Clp protease ATP-binding subunit ClpA